VCAFVNRDSFNNFSAGKLASDFLWNSFALLKELIQAGKIADRDFPLFEYLAEEYFKEFLEEFKNGHYDKLVNAGSIAEDTREEETLLRELYHNSSLIQPMIARFEKAVLAKNASKEFTRQSGNITYLALTAAYLMETNYDKARYNILQSLNRYPDGFTKSAGFELAILPQLAAYPQKGGEFLAELLSTGMHRKRIINYIAGRKDEFPEYIIAFLKNVVSGLIKADLKKSSIGELEPITRALGIEVSLAEDKDVLLSPKPEGPVQKLPVKTAEPGKATDTGQIAAVEDTVQKLEALQAPVKKKGKKQPKKMPKLKPDSPLLKKLDNALNALTQKFAVSENEEVFVYLQSLTLRPSLLKQALCVRVIAQVFEQMETEAGLNLLANLRDSKVSSVVISMVKEIDEMHQGLSDYFSRLRSFDVECKKIEQQLKQIDIVSLAQGEAYVKLADLQKKYKFLMDDYADIGSRKKGKAKHQEWTDKFNQVFLFMATDIKKVQEDKVRRFMESINAASKELDEGWEEIMSGSSGQVSKADIVLALRDWQETQTLPRPCADIREDERVRQAREELEQKWSALRVRINAAIEENSFICNGMVKFIITTEAAAVCFQGVKFPNNELDKLFPKECREVIEAIMRYNGEIDIESAISAQEYESVEGWLIPLLDKVKNIIRNSARVVKKSKLTQALDDLNGLYEQLRSGLDKIKAGNLGPLRLLKAINDFLPEEIGYPESVTEVAYNPAELVVLEEKIKKFDEKIEALYEQAEDMGAVVVCKGAFQISITGDFKSLYFEPLIKDPLKRDVENEARELIAEALSYDINVQVTVPEGVKQSLPWVQLIARLWQQELEIAKRNLAQQKLIDTQAAKRMNIPRENAELVNRAI